MPASYVNTIFYITITYNYHVGSSIYPQVVKYMAIDKVSHLKRNVNSHVERPKTSCISLPCNP